MMAVPADFGPEANDELNKLEESHQYLQQLRSEIRDNELSDEFFPLNQILLPVLLSQGIFGCDHTTTEPYLLYLPYSILDFSTCFTFQQLSDQRCMICLPTCTFENLHVSTDNCISYLNETMTNYKEILEYKCIYLIFFHKLHYSSAFVMNTGTVLDRSYLMEDNKSNPAPCILYYNLLDSVRHHTKEKAPSYVVKLLNGIYRDLKKGRTIYNKILMPVYQLKVLIQLDEWSCGFQILRAQDNVLSFLCKKGNVTEEEVALNFNSMSAYMLKGNILIMCEELLHKFICLASNSTSLGRREPSTLSVADQESRTINLYDDEDEHNHSTNGIMKTDGPFFRVKSAIETTKKMKKEQEKKKQKEKKKKETKQKKGESQEERTKNQNRRELEKMKRPNNAGKSIKIQIMNVKKNNRHEESMISTED